MPKFSKTSRGRLGSCDPALKRVFERVVERFDCTIVEGHRDKRRQNKAVAEGKSQLVWPKSAHNELPSRAVDAAPYYPGVGIVWNHPDKRVVRENATLFAGFVLGTAREMGIELRWGGDWNRNFETEDNRFDDFWHFELVS